MPYSIGDAVPLTSTIAAVAPGTGHITDPDGTTSAPALPQGGSPPAVTYPTAVAVPKAGTWLARFVATGAVADSEDQQFIVEPVATATLYATVNELRSSLSGNTSLDAGSLTAALRAASRAVDDHCQRPGRKFWLDPTVTARTYRPVDPWCVWIDDVGSSTGLLVKTDTNNDGTYETTWATSDYQLEPLNASTNGGAYAWWQLLAVGTLTFPYPITYRPSPTVQVTARHGWSAIPDPVRQATLLLAARYWRRRDVPFGNEAGFGDFGPMRITTRDADVMSLLAPYTIPTGFA